MWFWIYEQIWAEKSNSFVYSAATFFNGQINFSLCELRSAWYLQLCFFFHRYDYFFSRSSQFLSLFGTRTRLYEKKTKKSNVSLLIIRNTCAASKRICYSSATVVFMHRLYSQQRHQWHSLNGDKNTVRHAQSEAICTFDAFNERERLGGKTRGKGMVEWRQNIMAAKGGNYNFVVAVLCF